MNEMPRPTAAHAQLAILAGVWASREQIAPSPWDTKGGLAYGRCTNQLALNGFVVLHDYEQERGGAVTFRGHGVFSYDAVEGEYVLHWFDSMGLPPSVFRGSFEGATLRLACATTGKHQRVTWEFQDESRYRFRMEFSPDGCDWRTFMEGEANRCR
jgi:hypothetical protein